MPKQTFAAKPASYARKTKLSTSPASIGVRRALVIGGGALLALYGTYEMNRVLNSMGASALGMIVLALFAILGAWISLSFTSALAGFYCMLRHKDGLSLIDQSTPLPRLTSQTAIVLPIYNEDPVQVLRRLRTIFESLRDLARIDSFDFFILSDTTDPDLWVQEEAMYLDLLDKVQGEGRIFYRRRSKNIDRKSGNLEEWVSRFGAKYRQMLTLDADSIMDGALIVRLVAAMEQNQRVGLIQSLPIIIGGHTLFARMQQFAARVYGPLIAYGVAWWHGAESNYWGHNAVIRLEAFAQHAGLPHLPGRKPFGGSILSHDFVEAALMRRGGWAVHLVPNLIGSYEESPPSLTDVAIRDRRWCQGNLQHGKIIFAKGLHWVSRMHMAVGIGAYITAPLWLLFLLFGILISLQSYFYRPEYFEGGRTLYPHWPHVDPIRAEYVFFGTMLILIAPKILAWLAIMAERHRRRSFKSLTSLSASIVLETFLGGLIAPIAMLIHTAGVISILRGKDSGWGPQNRNDGHLSLRTVIQNYWIYSAFGLALAVSAWSVSQTLFLWMTPVLIGLVLAAPLAAVTASPRIGRFTQKLGLLIIPEETTPPPIVKKLLELERRDEAEHVMARGKNLADAFGLLARDHLLFAAHAANLPAQRIAGEPIDPHSLVGLLKMSEASDLETARFTLTRQEKLGILSSSEGVARIKELAQRREDLIASV